MTKDREQIILDKDEEIFEYIKDTLKKHDCRYLYDPDEPKKMKVKFETENKPFDIELTIQNKKVYFKLIFPFRVQCTALALVALYIAEFNEGRESAYINLNTRNGKITMEDNYTFCESDHYNMEKFWVYIKTLSLEPLEIYNKLHWFSVGQVKAQDERRFYAYLLRRAWMLVEDKDSYEDGIIYGTDDLIHEAEFKWNFKTRETGMKSGVIRNLFKEDDGGTWRSLPSSGVISPILNKKNDEEIFTPFEEANISSTSHE